MVKVNYVKLIEKLKSYGFTESNPDWRGVAKSLEFTGPQYKKKYGRISKYDPKIDEITLDKNIIIALKDFTASDEIEYTLIDAKPLTVDGIWIGNS